VDSSGDNCCSRTYENSGADPADCGAAGTTDMPGWDTSLVTDMHSLFEDETGFTQNIGSWNVSQVNPFTLIV